jgi:hypothetical protein
MLALFVLHVVLQGFVMVPNLMHTCWALYTGDT